MRLAESLEKKGNIRPFHLFTIVRILPQVKGHVRRIEIQILIFSSTNYTDCILCAIRWSAEKWQAERSRCEVENKHKRANLFGCPLRNAVFTHQPLKCPTFNPLIKSLSYLSRPHNRPPFLPTSKTRSAHQIIAPKQ